MTTEERNQKIKEWENDPVRQLKVGLLVFIPAMVFLGIWDSTVATTALVLLGGLLLVLGGIGIGLFLLYHLFKILFLS